MNKHVRALAHSFVVSAFLASGWSTAHAQNSDDGSSEGDAGVTIQDEPVFNRGELISRINGAYRRNQYDEAADLLRALIEREPNNALAWSSLGYALHSGERLDEALPAHLMASEFDRTRRTACYNIACIYARKGRTDRAIKWLEKAVEAGFQNAELMLTDDDLDSLRDDPRFGQLHAATSWRTTFGAADTDGRDTRMTTDALTAPPETLEPRRQFDFWVGRWNVFSVEGNLVGTNRIELSMNGNLIEEHWEAKSGSKGRSTNFHDPSNDAWTQVWVDENAQLILMSGGFSDGAMRLTGSHVFPDGRARAFRSMFAPQEDGSVLQLLEESEDGGATWKTWFEGVYRRADPQDDPNGDPSANPKDAIFNDLRDEGDASNSSSP